MGYVFDGDNRLIVLTPGTTVLNVLDLYSRWKDWVQLSDNSKYLQAFQPVGGDPINPIVGSSIPGYLYLQNGWRVRPQEASHTLQVTTGILLTAEFTTPFIDTIGAFNVRVEYSQPVKAEALSTGGGTAPTAAEVADAVWDEAAADHLAAGSTGELQVAAALSSGGLSLQQATMLLEIYRLLGLDPSYVVEHGTAYIRCPADGSQINIAVNRAGSTTGLQRLP